MSGQKSYNAGTVSIALGVFSKAKKGDKAKFLELLVGGGIRKGLNEHWKAYLEASAR